MQRQVSLDGQLRQAVEHYYKEGNEEVVTAHCV
jgi:hypothetical protein